MKKIFFGALALILVLVPSYYIFNNSQKAQAAGTTYYVRADGTVTCANKANATSPSNVNTSLNMAQVNACTFTDGDQVLFSSQGGGYTAALTISSGGSGVGNEIIYANVLSETPAISINTYPIITTNIKSNIKIRGFSLVYTGTNVGAYGVRIRAGSNIALETLSINMGGYGGGVLSLDTVSTVLIDSLTLTNMGSTPSAINLYGAASSNITVQNCNITGSYGIDIRNASNVTVDHIVGPRVYFETVTTGTISDITATSAGALAFTSLHLISSSGIAVSDYTYSGTDFSLNIGSASHDITIDRLIVSGAAGKVYIGGTSYNVIINDSSITGATGGFYVKDTAHDIIFNRCSATDSTPGSGFVTENNSYNVAYNYCNADRNAALGFVTSDASHDVTYQYCSASYNGQVDNASDGGGFLPHGTTTNVKVYNCIAHHNRNEGIGDVSTGNNIFYNCVNWDNGVVPGDTFRGGIVTVPNIRGNMYFNKTGGSAIIKNVISGGGKPREIKDWGTTHATYDYNLYLPLDNSKFMMTDGVNEISWATYHSTNEPHSQNADPRFVSTVTPDFHLQSTSPAIDAGISTSAPTTDYAGKQRYDDPDVPNTGGGTYPYYDIGAYEYVLPPNPTFFSSSHPSQTSWYSNPSVRIYLASGGSSTTNYRYLVSQDPAPLKSAVQAGTFDANGAFDVIIPSDGQWYIHILAENLDNEPSTNYDSYGIKLDSVDPTINSVNLTEGQIISGTYTIFTNAIDSLSGMQKVEFYIDNELKSTVTSTPYQYDWDTTKYHSPHTVKVVAYDQANNTTENTYNVQVVNQLPDTGSIFDRIINGLKKPLNILLIGLALLIIVISSALFFKKYCR